jgi:mono/diheme cytochrome c family protein
LSRARFALALSVVVLAGTGCWEQVSREWFSQMKRQPAVQAFENVAPLAPPEGTVPIGGIEPRIDSPVPAFSPQAMALQNPIPPTAQSVSRGKELYDIYCLVCHGPDGMARPDEVPVAKKFAESGMPPLPLIAVPGYPDGLIFTKIRYGKPGMPGYPQIASEDRWHVVNYLRNLMTPKPPS